MPTFADRLKERLEPWNVGAETPQPLTTSETLETSELLMTGEVETLTDFERWLEGIGAEFQPILNLAEEEGADGDSEVPYIPAWGKLFDPNTVTFRNGALAYLAQYVGVEIPTGSTEAEARALLKRESGLARGTLQSIEAAIAGALNVGEPYFVIERTNPKTAASEAYAFTVIIGTGGKAAVVKAAVETVKPGGLFFEVLEVKDRWIESKKRWNEVAGGLKWSEASEANT